MNESSTYYFGYGTLLGIEEMHRYCPSAEKVAIASYPGHRLEFWAYTDEPDRVGCHLVAAPGEDAYGVVYRLSAREAADLDRASGVDRGWFRRDPIEVVTLAGEPLAVTTYFLVAPTRPETPDDDYSGLVRTGLRTEAELPNEFVERLTEYLDALPPRLAR